MKKGLSIVINLVLFAVIVFLAWQVVKSIQAPIKFNTEKDIREAQIVERLKDIRSAEVLYKQVHSKYTASFDSLINFCQTDSLPVIKMTSVYNPADSTYSTITDTIAFLSIMDSIRKGQAERINEFDIHKIKYVPFGGQNQTFELEAGSINRNGVDIPVFEARTPFEVYLATPGRSFTQDKWDERVRNLKEEIATINRARESNENKKYAGLKVGSMDDAVTDGNWEKL